MSTGQDTALSVFDRQQSFAFENAGFWKKKQQLLASVRPADYLMDKHDLRSEDALAFVPESSKKDLRYCFATSGTTGEPTFSFWTEEDWNLKIKTIVTGLRSRFELPKRITALNCYSINCLAGAILDDVIKALGGVSIGAAYFHKDSESLQHLIKKLRCNTLIMGSSGNSYKFSVGAYKFFSDSLKSQPLDLEWWLGSGPISKDTLEFVRRLHIPLITTLYGCSEVGFFSIGCPLDPSTYHLLEGDILVERAIDEKRSNGGNRSRILVSRVGEFNVQAGVYTPHRGSQYLRYFTGDAAAWNYGNCACGSKLPVLSGVRRIP